MKTKMTKAMYGKSMMKKGGSKKSLPKAQMGKAVSGTPSYAKSQSKAEKLYDSDPSVRTYTNELTGKSIPTGPMTKEEYQSAAERAASKRAKALGAGPTMKKGGAMKKMQKGGLQKAATKRRTIEKMMTGGMVNPNSSVSAQKTASSKGSGKVNTPPSKAVPTAKRGGMVKKKR